MRMAQIFAVLMDITTKRVAAAVLALSPILASPGAEAIVIAQTNAINMGAWIFDSSVTLLPNTSHFFYMAGPLASGGTTIYCANAYGGGAAYAGSSGTGGAYLYYPGSDMRFRLESTPVTDTPEPASALLLAPVLLVLLRLRRPHATGNRTPV